MSAAASIDAGAGAVILAAGMGTRLRPYTDETPKCLVPVIGRPILERALNRLAECGVRSVCIVLGYRGDRIRNFLAGRFPEMDIRFTQNDEYATTGTCVSLLKGLDAIGAAAVTKRVLVVEGDVVFERGIAAGLLPQYHSGGGGRDFCGTVLAPYAPSLTGTYATLDRAGWVSDWVHERVRPADFDLTSAFKTVNLTSVPAAAAARVLIPALRRTVEADGPGAPLEFAMRRCVRDERLPIQGILTGTHRWFEVDNEEDLRIAERLFAHEARAAAEAEAGGAEPASAAGRRAAAAPSELAAG
jgi:NDP-sugar pyrophosphorylase family protein